MNAERAYLDYNASAPLLPVARAAMLAALDAGGNASSVHGAGRGARAMVETARRQVAGLVGGQAAHVVFTSGATEAANTLLTPDWTMGRAPLRFASLHVCAADHPATLSGGRFPVERRLVYGVNADGIADLGELDRQLSSAGGMALVAVHAANNETGVLQPLPEIAALVRRHGGALVVDAVQAAGRVHLDITGDCGDFFILSAHKLGGPQGAGAIVGVADLMMPVPLLAGGGQERGHRAGTVNVAAIAGFGAACAAAAQALADMPRLAQLRDAVEKAVLSALPDAIIHGRRAPRLANTTFFTLPGIKAETAQIACDLAGVAVSAGSACSSGRVGPSHVLRAMGFSGEEGALRVSVGLATEARDVERFAAVLGDLVRRHGAAKVAA